MLHWKQNNRDRFNHNNEFLTHDIIKEDIKRLFLLSVECSTPRIKSNAPSMMYHQFITLMFTIIFRNSRIEHEPTGIHVPDIKIILENGVNLYIDITSKSIHKKYNDILRKQYKLFKLSLNEILIINKYEFPCCISKDI